MTTEKRVYGTWTQNGIEIDEIEFDGDRHAFEVCVDGKHVVTIYADTPEDTEGMRASLDDGYNVGCWENGNGICIGTLIRQRTTGLRDTLRRIENEGRSCYSGRLSNGAYGTVWIDKATATIFEYETEIEALFVGDLTDEDLENVIIGGL